ncbi:hypothetical protein [Priestia aryabhattai]
MYKVWIQEEKINSSFLNDTGHHMRIDGDIQSSYFINADQGDNQVDDNKNYLTQFLITQEKYPLFITFVCYEDYEELEEIIKNCGLKYTVNFLEENRKYWTDGKSFSYNPPYLTVKVDKPEELKFVIEETYWLPTQNEFYAISTTKNLYFNLEEVSEWGKMQRRSTPHFKCEINSTFITIFHDGYGFYLFSNEERYNTVEKLCVTLPPNTKITQINDELIDNENC